MKNQRTNSTFAITHLLFIFKGVREVSHFAQVNAQIQNCKRAISSNATCKIHISKKNVRKLS